MVDFETEDEWKKARKNRFLGNNLRALLVKPDGREVKVPADQVPHYLGKGFTWKSFQKDEDTPSSLEASRQDGGEGEPSSCPPSTAKVSAARKRKTSVPRAGMTARSSLSRSVG